ncbi:hypothetical protein [Kitasatospora sp. NPDC090308]|uniref:hypothetical protein n=1 Tax=Kitasatospora sp. NPDC090308 TaxID=3364082 RepID=UPI003806A1CB
MAAIPSSDDSPTPVHDFGPRPTVPACDFCSRPGAVVFFRTVEFALDLGGVEWLSGDRFYACPTCRSLVDAANWPGLIAYAELGPRGVRVVEGFRDHHAPGAVVFEPGTNPEQGR